MFKKIIILALLCLTITEKSFGMEKNCSSDFIIRTSKYYLWRKETYDKKTYIVFVNNYRNSSRVEIAEPFSENESSIFLTKMESMIDEQDKPGALPFFLEKYKALTSKNNIK